MSQLKKRGWAEAERTLGVDLRIWESRVKEMSKLIGSDVRSVLDLGAGTMFLEQFLPPEVEYYPVDYVSRGKSTIVCNFNNHEFPSQKTDMIFMSGLLEYIEDVDWFLDKVAEHTEILIFSYNPIEYVPDISFREGCGWNNHQTIAQLISTIQKREFCLVSYQKYVNRQVIFKFVKTKPATLPEYALCTGCGTCFNQCDADAIKMDYDERGFLHPVIKTEKCVGCGECVRVCPSLHPHYLNSKEPACYAAMAEDTIREDSSSGGVFTLLAENILSKGGKVAGVAWGEDLNIEHALISRVEEIPRLRHSKYVQSDTGTIYRQVKEQLETSPEQVLFTGCPCQIAGLYSYLGREYDNLVTMDILCLYSPPQPVFKKYLKENFGDEVKSFTFRSKKRGWSSYTQRIEKRDGTETLNGIEDDWFQKGFHALLYSHTACDNCCFAEYPRQADLSVGDFWGIDQHAPNLDDRKGTSLVLVNNEKGKRLLEEVKSRFKTLEAVPTKWVGGNRVFHHIEVHPHRERFFSLVKKFPFNKTVEHALQNSYDVAVVGPWSGYNYGANLTYFALYKTLCGMGYQTMMVERPRSLAWAPNEEPERFQQNPYPNHDLCIVNNELEMRALNEYCNTFVLGSDQLWNDELAKHWGNFTYLGFVSDSNKKIAYATSFGHDKYSGPEKTRSRMHYHLNKFDFVSVREESGIQICRDTFGIEAAFALDPVFLCEVAEFNHLAELSNISETKHIATYLLDPTDQKQQACQTISIRMGQKLLNLPDAVLTEEAREAWHLDIREDYSTEDWLKVIQNSSFVITDSFHGMCFAIIFKKPFIAIANQARGVARFTSLLTRLNLTNRLVYSPEEIETRPELFDPIDYKPVYQILDNEKANSCAWLKNAVEMPVAKEYSAFEAVNDRIDPIEKRLFDAESYNFAQDARMNAIDAHNFAQDDRMGAIDAHNFAQDDRMGAIDAHNFAQDDRMNAIDAHNFAQDDRMNAIDAHNFAQDAQIAVLRAEQGQQSAQLSLMHENFCTLQTMLQQKEEQLFQLYRSKSYLIGRAVTYLPRKVISLLRRS